MNSWKFEAQPEAYDQWLDPKSKDAGKIDKILRAGCVEGAQAQRGINTDEAPALLRDLSKILESNSGIDAAGRKGNCSLTIIGERPTFNSRKTTGPMLQGSAIILPLKFGLPSSSDVRWPFFSSFWANSFFVKKWIHGIFVSDPLQENVKKRMGDPGHG